MLKNHLGGLLSYFRHRVTNAITEGFNSRIQSVKTAARGRKGVRYLFRLNPKETIDSKELVSYGCSTKTTSMKTVTMNF
jgi:hypothetical protein